MSFVKDNSLEFGLEPLHGILLGHLVLHSNSGLTRTALGHTISWTIENDIEIHSINTSGWIILNTEINVLVDTESKVSRAREVLSQELVFLHLESSLEELKGLLSTDGHAAGNLLITTDTPLTDSVSSLSENWLLSGELFQHLGGLLQTISGLSHADVEHELVHADIPTQ